jgi:hypothetical protein
VLEALMPVMRAARLREPTSPQLLKNRELYNKVGDDEVLQVFARELGPLGETAVRGCSTSSTSAAPRRPGRRSGTTGDCPRGTPPPSCGAW